MGIRLKIFFIILAVFLASSFVTWFATEYLVRSQYIKIENENTKKDTQRGTNALQNRIEQLAQKTPDWSAWDDTYKFIQDKNDTYIESNIQAESLQSLSINYMLFFNEKNELVHSTGVSTESGANIPIPKELSDAFGKDSKLLTKSETDEYHGLLKTSSDPLIISTRPILKSDGTGPVRGTLVFAEYLTNEDISKISQLTQLDLALTSAVDSIGNVMPEFSEYSSERPTIKTQGAETITGYQIFNDIYDKSLLSVSVSSPRTIFQQTQETLVFYILIILGVTLASIIVVMHTTGRIVKQSRTLEMERLNKKEIEKQVVERTREAEEEQARLHSAMDGLNAGLLITFKDRDEVSYNPASVNILGLRDAVDYANKNNQNVTLGQILKRLEAIKHADIKSKIDECQNNGKPFEIKEIGFENKVLGIFGAPVMVQMDKIIGAVILIEDITERKVLERSKDEFFSIASHELRTPLTAIKGNSSMVLQYFKKELKNKELHEMIDDIHDSSERLIEIVNDFLDLSRLEQGKIRFNFTPISLEKVIEAVASEMKNMLAKKKLEIKVDKATISNLPEIWADEGRLQQVLYNLIGNSAKFTEKGSISISATSENDTVKVLVTDTGRGMNEEAKKLLFHKFQQAGDSLLTRDTTKGTGLGLYISKMILESMGGKINLEKSELGKGTTFSFTLPVATRQANETLDNTDENTRPKKDL